MKKFLMTMSAATVLLMVSGCGNAVVSDNGMVPTMTPTIKIENTVIPEPTNTPMPELTETLVPTESLTPTSIPTPVSEPTGVPKVEPTEEPTPTSEPVPTEVPEPTSTPEPTPTEVPEVTVEPTETPEPTPTEVPEPKVEPTVAPTEAPVATVEPTKTPEVPTVTATPTPKPTATATPTPKPTATPKPTSTPKPTATPKPTSTPIPTATPMPIKTTVPNVIGMPAIDAGNLLQSICNVPLGIIYAYSDTIEKGKVCWQDPKEGTDIKGIRSFQINISMGPDPRLQTGTIIIPNVIGMEESAAKKLLLDAGFNTVNVLYEYTDTVEKGEVSKQEYEAGKEEKFEKIGYASIDIKVSKGPSKKPDDFMFNENKITFGGVDVVVPNVVLEALPDDLGDPVSVEVADESDYDGYMVTKYSYSDGLYIKIYERADKTKYRCYCGSNYLVRWTTDGAITIDYPDGRMFEKFTQDALQWTGSDGIVTEHAYKHDMGGGWYAWMKTVGPDITPGYFRIVNSDGSYNHYSNVLYKYNTSQDTHMSSYVNEAGKVVDIRNWYLTTIDGEDITIPAGAFPLEDY